MVELQALYESIKEKAVKEFEEKQKKSKEEAKKAGKDKKTKKNSKPPKRSPGKDEEVAKDALYELKLIKAINTESDVKKVLEERKNLKGIDNWVQVQSYLAVEDFDKAVEVTAKDVEKNKNKVVFLARHIYTLSEAGKKDEAKKQFDYLRTVSGDIDLGVLPFIRLTGIAAEFGFPENWRLPHKKYDDLGKRPELASLGPFRWQPVKSREFNLPDHENKLNKLSALNNNQPVLLIFYLGASCSHCVDQINAFKPLKEKYEKAGIKIVAVSTESVNELKESAEYFSKDGKFPFQMFCDPKLTTFKQYRCYDDFEDFALHGTFLIDRNGFIRWQDISYEPFMKAEFLLKESKRLLSQPEKLIYGKELSGANLNR